MEASGLPPLRPDGDIGRRPLDVGDARGDQERPLHRLGRHPPRDDAGDRAPGHRAGGRPERHDRYRDRGDRHIVLVGEPLLTEQGDRRPEGEPLLLRARPGRGDRRGRPLPRGPRGPPPGRSRPGGQDARRRREDPPPAGGYRRAEHGPVERPLQRRDSVGRRYTAGILRGRRTRGCPAREGADHPVDAGGCKTPLHPSAAGRDPRRVLRTIGRRRGE